VSPSPTPESLDVAVARQPEMAGLIPQPATAAEPLAPGAFLPALASWSLSRRSWWSVGGVLLGGVVLGEVSHLGSTGLTLLAAGAGWWWWRRRSGKAQIPDPSDASGWLERCSTLLEQFERLDPEGVEAQNQRRARLERWQADRSRQALTLAVVGDPALLATDPSGLASVLSCSVPLQLHLGHRLPQQSADWQWPQPFAECDALLYVAPAPLRASDLRWLTALPQGQAAWLLLRCADGLEAQSLEAELNSQLGPDATAELLLWDGEAGSFEACLAPVGQGLRRSPHQRIASSRLRSLQALHRQWQAELEGWRRQRFQTLQQRTQWLVAASVVASPLPAADLAVVVIGNGLMLQEMAALWDCDWSIRDLQVAAGELASAAIALGVAEWSSQALLSLMRLHGASWLVGSALQALSAAYLTRVVAHAMADVMALSVGVEAPDLARIKREAPLLVARAAEAEKVDWSAFLGQARDWLQQQQGPSQAIAN